MSDLNLYKTLIKYPGSHKNVSCLVNFGYVTTENGCFSLKNPRQILVSIKAAGIKFDKKLP